MGGNALKNIEVTRMTLEEFNETKDKVQRVIAECSLQSDIPKYFKNKDSFGDVDIVVKIKNQHDQELCIEHIKNCFKPRDFYKNSNVFSFDCYNHQVDLIFTPEQHYKTSLNYLSYNDLFNLLGRLAHKLGLKLGHKGLQVIVKRGNYKLGEATLTKDLELILGILDVDYKRYQEGFNTKEEIFDFVMASMYFSNDIFAFENLNHINRTRNKKRAVYTEFVEYTSTRSKNGLKPDKEKFVKRILKKFPEANQAVIKLEKLRTRQLAVKEIFNGDIVAEVKGVSGIELGKWMKHFKAKYNNEFWLEHKNDARDIIANELNGGIDPK